MRTVKMSTGWIALLSMLTVWSSSDAFAQGHTPDPYNIVGEYNSQYEPYLYASEPSEEGTLPNQYRQQGRVGATRSQDDQEDFDNLDEETQDPADSSVLSTRRRRAGSGTPYYRSALDPDRVTGPKRESDDNYFDNQRKRTEDYFKALSVKDPKKRARLLRDLNAENLRVSRMLPNFKGSSSSKRGESVSFDSPAEDGKKARRSSEDVMEEESSTRRSSGSDLRSTTDARSRSGLSSSSRRSSATAKAKGAKTKSAPQPRDGSPSTEEILRRSERLEALRRGGSPNP